MDINKAGIGAIFAVMLLVLSVGFAVAQGTTGAILEGEVATTSSPIQDGPTPSGPVNPIQEGSIATPTDPLYEGPIATPNGPVSPYIDPVATLSNPIIDPLVPTPTLSNPIIDPVSPQPSGPVSPYVDPACTSDTFGSTTIGGCSTATPAPVDPVDPTAPTPPNNGGSSSGGSGNGDDEGSPTEEEGNGPNNNLQTTNLANSADEGNNPLGDEETSNQSNGFLAGITGAVIGTLGQKGALGAGIFIVVLGLAGLVVYNRNGSAAMAEAK